MEVKFTAKQRQIGIRILASLLAVIVVAVTGYLVVKNANKVVPLATIVEGSYSKPDNWATHSDRYVPIVFDYPKEWEIQAVESDYTTSQSTIRAYINKGKSGEKVMLDISYMRLYAPTKQSSSTRDIQDAVADGVSVTPKCPMDVKQSASSECAVVSNAINSGYIYRDRGRDAKDVVRWYGQDSNERLTLESYAVDEFVLGNIVKSIRGNSNRSDRDMPVAMDKVTASEQAQNRRNSEVVKDAVSRLSPKKCEDIKGVTYKVNSSDSSKVTIFDEWQALIACRAEVNIAIKKDKAVSLRGDNCSQSNIRYAHLRRAITNAKLIQRRAPISVTTSNGVKTIVFNQGSVNDELPDNVDTTCESISGNSLKDGDTVSIYVPANNSDPEAYEYDTIVIQKVNSSLQ